jgi:site-specific DNA-methyltransferase (adenine-specific)
MEGMKEFPDKYFELAVVDPEYGIGGHEGNNHWVRSRFSKKGKEWDNKRASPKYFNELFRVSKNQIIWGGNYFVDHLFPSMGWICWHKTDECVGRAFSEFELAFTSFDRAARTMELKPFQRNGSRIHPTQKPIALYQWLLKNYAKPGDKILDTHLGSGSSRIAAYKMGFDFWGYELDKDYFEAQEKRFKEAIAQPLFDIPKSTQAKLL